MKRAENGVRRTLAPPGYAAPPMAAARGIFIVLEGIDGSGKTTQAKLLAAWLRGCGREVLETFEPTHGPHGLRYRSWARGDLEAKPEEVLGWFVEDRREHVALVIQPALARGEIVICDRYAASTRAYQAAQGIDRGLVERVLGAHSFPEPDATLWLRIPIDVAIERMGSAATERFEHADFLNRVDAEYERLGLQPIDAGGSPEQVQAELRRRVAAILGDPKCR
jgi:dTMP kinase